MSSGHMFLPGHLQSLIHTKSFSHSVASRERRINSDVIEVKFKLPVYFSVNVWLQGIIEVSDLDQRSISTCTVQRNRSKPLWIEKKDNLTIKKRRCDVLKINNFGDRITLITLINICLTIKLISLRKISRILNHPTHWRYVRLEDQNQIRVIARLKISPGFLFGRLAGFYCCCFFLYFYFFFPEIFQLHLGLCSVAQKVRSAETDGVLSTYKLWNFIYTIFGLEKLNMNIHGYSYNILKYRWWLNISLFQFFFIFSLPDFKYSLNSPPILSCYTSNKTYLLTWENSKSVFLVIFEKSVLNV